MFVGEFVRAGVDVALHLDAVIDVNITRSPEQKRGSYLALNTVPTGPVGAVGIECRAKYRAKAG